MVHTLLVFVLISFISTRQTLEVRYPAQPVSDSCNAMFSEAVQYESPLINDTHKAFDTLKRFIQSCPFNENAPRAFSMLTTAAQGTLPRDTMAWLHYRLWLESVLYLNTVNPEYFCACVEAIAQTYYSKSDTGRSYYLRAPNRSLTILQWLIQNTTCDTPNLATQYRTTRYYQYQLWREDTTAPFDTTLATLQQLGLDTVLAKHLLFVAVEKPAPTILSAIASPNPSTGGTLVTFSLDHEAYVKLELYDVLGNRVEIPPLESLFEAGNHAVSLSLHNLASGTYYVRLVTAYGEAQTVKIVNR